MADQIYRIRDNRNFCRGHKIRLSGPKLGRPSQNAKADKIQEYKAQMRLDNTDRIEVERAFSLDKRCYGMGRRILKMDPDEINIINNYLKKQLWMEFELCSTVGDDVEMFGYLDVAEDDKIKIIFLQPYMILCTIFFIYEGEGDFITLVKGDQLAQLYKKYNVSEGNQIYRINNTDINGDIYIIAKGIEVQVMD